MGVLAFHRCKILEIKVTSFCRTAFLPVQYCFINCVRRLLLRRCGWGWGNDVPEPGKQTCSSSEETSLQKCCCNALKITCNRYHTQQALMSWREKYHHSLNRHISWSGLIIRPHPLGAGAQEAEERRVEVEVLGVELLQLLHPNVDDLRGQPESKRRRPRVKTLHLYYLCTSFLSFACVEMLCYVWKRFASLIQMAELLDDTPALACTRSGLPPTCVPHVCVCVRRVQLDSA